MMKSTSIKHKVYKEYIMSAMKYESKAQKIKSLKNENKYKKNRNLEMQKDQWKE